jgi:hypothetical protein
VSASGVRAPSFLSKHAFVVVLCPRAFLKIMGESFSFGVSAVPFFLLDWAGLIARLDKLTVGNCRCHNSIR